MKQFTTLLIAAVIIVKTLSAQYETSGLCQPYYSQNYNAKRISNEFINIHNTNNNTKTIGVSVVDIGSSSDMYSTAFKCRNNFIASDKYNLVAMIYTSDSALNGDTNKGCLRYSYSKDGGATWNMQQGPLYKTNGAFYSAAFPQAVLVDGNDPSPDSSYIIFFAPVKAGINGAYGGYAYGYKKLGDTAQNAYQFQETSSAYGVPYTACKIGKNSPNFLFADLQFNLNTGVYVDTVILLKGNFQNKQLNFQKIKLPLQVTPGTNPADIKVAFSDDGLTGYIVVLANIALTQSGDTVINPVMLKTTDGGSNWSVPYEININSFAQLKNDLNITGSITCGFDVDLVVDKFNQAHLICAIGKSKKYATLIHTPGNWGMVHIETNGSIVNKVRLLRKPMSYSVVLGKGSANEIIEYNRPNASISENGAVIYFSHVDTDTILYPGTGNSNPDLFIDHYLPFNGSGTINGNSFNATLGTSAEAMMLFSSLSYTGYIGLNNCYMATFTNHSVSNDNTKPGMHKYLLQIYNTACLTSVDDVAPQPIIVINKIYPNPVYRTAIVSIAAAHDILISYEIVNLLGEVVSSDNSVKLFQGMNNVEINLEDNANGIYFIKINTQFDSLLFKVMKY